MATAAAPLVPIVALLPAPLPAPPAATAVAAAPPPLLLHLREADLLVPVRPRSIASDVVAAALALVPGGAPQAAAGYALFEAEFTRRPADPLSASAQPQLAAHEQGASSPSSFMRNKRRPSTSQDGIQRRLIRALDPDECPLAVLTSWQFIPAAGNYIFVIKARENDTSSVFANLRQEQCRNLSLEKLQRRLQTVANDETVALEELRKRYETHRAAVLARIEELQGK